MLREALPWLPLLTMVEAIARMVQHCAYWWSNWTADQMETKEKQVQHAMLCERGALHCLGPLQSSLSDRPSRRRHAALDRLALAMLLHERLGDRWLGFSGSLHEVLEVVAKEL